MTKKTSKEKVQENNIKRSEEYSFKDLGNIKGADLTKLREVIFSRSLIKLELKAISLDGEITIEYKNLPPKNNLAIFLKKLIGGA